MQEIDRVLSIQVPHLLDEINRREAALWVRVYSKGRSPLTTLGTFTRLPWRLVLAELSDENIESLRYTESPADPLVRKRGFVQLISHRPSEIELPKRCLPIYLLGEVRKPKPYSYSMAEQLRRLEMLDLLRTSGIRRVVIWSYGCESVPQELTDMWANDLRSYITFVSDQPDSNEQISSWTHNIVGRDRPIVSLYDAQPEDFATTIIESYFSSYRDDKTIIRLRDHKGTTTTLDISDADNPDRPILDGYSVIQERDLISLVPEEITDSEFESFFRGISTSWRPHAAGLVWERPIESEHDLADLLQRIDEIGPDENCLAYVSSESGAGGTTFVRNLAWKFAQQGYPVLIADAIPIAPDALSVSNFMSSVYEKAKHLFREKEFSDSALSATRRYEPPWIIVYDRVHWQHHDGELLRLKNILRRRGRPACILVVCGPRLSTTLLSADCKNIGDLSHTLTEEEAIRLGKHLNRYLTPLGKSRTESQWREFHRQHSAEGIAGVSAFWVVLSFWLTRQFDLSDTLQAVLYRAFSETVRRKDLQRAILYIAAMSVERIPLPNDLLPPSDDDWPIHQHLEDERTTLGALGLFRIGRTTSSGGWVLIHDVLGRLLLNALYQDRKKLVQLELSEAQDNSHLRFLLLSEISKNKSLGLFENRDLGDQFATSIFKIDPDHGRGEFLFLWREVLQTLDLMPDTLRHASRVFLHHTSVSRRRIAKFDPNVTNISIDERKELIIRAIQDIEIALNNIDFTDGSESDLNLYNSLAHAYMDLSEFEQIHSGETPYVIELRQKAKEAALNAYRTNPTNSFAIETFVRHLLSDYVQQRDEIVENCTTALGILFETISSNRESYRLAKLDNLAQQAMKQLMAQEPDSSSLKSPKNAVDVLVNAWTTLFSGIDPSKFSLEDLPERNRLNAIEVLDHEKGIDSTQVVRLMYELIAITFPHDFGRQLFYIEQLQGVDGSDSLQERLEYAILLFEAGRPADGARLFTRLRRTWREREHFVHVPNRLRWLFDNSGNPRVVQAIVRPEGTGRPMAQIQELRNCRAPFRPEEFGTHDPTPGMRFSGYVSFGYNGPFLRPVTTRET